MEKQLLIAIDYDHTFTEDPPLWRGFIRRAQASGHEVICVTMRHETEAIEMPVPVFYTGRKAKKPHMDALGHDIDIWIDDTPAWILTDAL